MQIPTPRRPKRRWFARPGVAVLMVLLLLSVTLTLSYAMLRTQSQVELIAQNFDRQLNARLAAQAGMAKALQAMNESTWGGVSSTVTGSLDAQTTFSASYATGDSSLTSTSPDYQEYPFRVTVTSVGMAADLNNSANVQTFTIRAVVQLIRKKLTTSPTGWSDLQQYSVMQWNSSRSGVVQNPLRITGNVYYRGAPTLFPDYPLGTTPRGRYLTDLNSMRSAGYGDHRPFGGTVTLPSSTSATSQTLLTTNLATTVVTHTNTSTSAPVTHPGNVENYRLYPGGKRYTVPDLYTQYGATLTGVTLNADPLNNPLGIYRASSTIRLGNNTAINGTILASSSNNVDFRGTSVSLTGRALPALHNSSATYQLPAAIVNNEINVEATANATIQGLLIAWDQFEVDPRNANTRLNLTGRIIANDVDLHGISSWDLSSFSWGLLNYWFEDHYPAVEHFPVYLWNYFGMNYQPLLTVQPNSSGVQYHWHTWSEPVYIADPADGGLRWNLISWAEGV